MALEKAELTTDKPAKVRAILFIKSLLFVVLIFLNSELI